LDKNDPETWDKYWPPSVFSKRGFISGGVDHYQQSWNNRMNPNIYELFSRILGPTIWVDPDRYGVMRPTKNIVLKDGSMVDRMDWITEHNWLHWDQNPWTEPDFVRVQGLLALVDNTESTGSFHCVPGFPSYFREWGQKNINIRKLGGLINVPENDIIRSYIQKITLRAGSFLIWDSRLPHGNFPNSGDQFRMVQYIRMEQSKENDEQKIKERFTMWKMNPGPQPVLSELGEKLMGFRNWSDNGLNLNWSFLEYNFE